MSSYDGSYKPAKSGKDNWLESIASDLKGTPDYQELGPIGTSTKYVPRCYESHPVFKLGNGIVRGGSCSNPDDGYDVYVGLDGYMYQRPPYPWETNKQKFDVVHFKIPDMGVPKDVKNFKAMIVWLAEKLDEGKKIHVGCIGGHGRTGMVLSALVNHVTGNANSTTWVRKHYCKKAVESSEQVDWLFKHFGIKKVAPAKVWTSPSHSSYKGTSSGSTVTGSYTPSSGTSLTSLSGGSRRLVKPVPSKKSIW